MTDVLKAIYDSTAELYAAHGLDANSVPPEQRRRYLNEEHHELQEASIIDDQFGTNKWSLVAEAADVLVTVCGLLQAHGISYGDLCEGVGRVLAKNDGKRQPAYTMTNGKIRKAQP